MTNSYWNRLAILVASIVEAVKTFARKEPAVIIGAAASLGVTVQQWLTTNNVHSWKQAATLAAPLALSWLIRLAVTSPATRDALVEAAVEIGKLSK